MGKFISKYRKKIKREHINVSDIINHVINETGYEHYEVSQVINQFFTNIKHRIVNEDRVKIPSLGSFWKKINTRHRNYFRVHFSFVQHIKDAFRINLWRIHEN